jgi:hypothetical protein
LTPGLRTLEDFLRHRLTVDRRTELSIRKDGQGRFQANLKNPDGSFTVDVQPDPADALWNVLAPYTLRHRAPSGRELVGDQKGFVAQTPVATEEDLF